MRILLTTHVFLPDFFGGTETLVHDIALTLKQRGHTVIVVTGYPAKPGQEVGIHFDEYEVGLIHVVRFKHSRDSSEGGINAMKDDYANPVFDVRFCQLLDEFRPDVVHIHHLERLSVGAIDACKERRIPTFLTATDFWYVCPTHALLLPGGKICDGPVRGGANCLKHLATISQPPLLAGMVSLLPAVVVGGVMALLKDASREFSGRLGHAQALARRRGVIADKLQLLLKIFVPTRFTQTVLGNNGIKTDKFRVLPFGIADHGYVKRTRCRTGSPMVLGFIGSLLPHKGLHVFLEAMRQLPSESCLAVRIYGSSPDGESWYANTLHTLAQHDKRITFCGTFENEKLPAVLDEIDALVIPSLWHENMPLVSLSAQAAGCPLIASNIGGLSDIVKHGENGLLFTPGAVSELAQLLSHLLSDRDLLTKLSSAALSPLWIDQHVDELELEYKKACGERY